MMFEGFESRRIAVNGTEIHLRIGGSGPPLLLVHGYPQTHLMWHRLAPAPLPERLIGADPEFFLRTLMTRWAMTPGCFDDAAMAEYIRCFSDPATIHATCEDYRAGYAIDRTLDSEDRAAGRKINCPVLALWGERGAPGKDVAVLDVWKDWCTDVRGHGVPGGHFLPEEAPLETLAAFEGFFVA